MGMTYAEVRLMGPRGATSLPLVVDTDSLLTWVSRERLEAIGIRPKGVRKIRTIDGSEVDRETGEALIEVMGERATRVVVLAEPGDAEVLGVDSLEALGLEVDPATRAIRKTQVFAAYRL
jgi:predicted aspartyl protease